MEKTQHVWSQHVWNEHSSLCKAAAIYSIYSSWFTLHDLFLRRVELHGTAASVRTLTCSASTHVFVHNLIQDYKI